MGCIYNNQMYLIPIFNLIWYKKRNNSFNTNIREI